jgi:hypothetical protein
VTTDSDHKFNPDGKSDLNLAAARLRHIAGTHWSTRKYRGGRGISDQLLSYSD